MFSEIVKNSSKKFISLEICPSKEFNVGFLNDLKPTFCSVPWFSDSDSRVKAGDFDNIPAITFASCLQSNGHKVLLHLAGRNLTQENALTLLHKIKLNGIRSILVLQGNGPFSDDDNCEFPHAVDLVKFIKKHFQEYFSIGVAGYPDKHPEAETFETDLQCLKEKINCGASFIMTQASFDYEILKKYYENCRKIDINVPIIPGLFIINSFDSLKMMSNMCKVHFPDHITKYVEEHKDDSATIKAYGIQLVQSLTRRIFTDHLFPGVHIFTLNQLEKVEILYEGLQDLLQ